ncbi:MAG: elongation factor P [Erysipelotrichaceae bacterium]|jgi:elongation factor P|nr:elongation factor P [Erysipelotrichaceae bacterium]
MINVNDIKNGMTILFEDNIYTVLEFSHVKPGKGAAFVQAKLKNLRTGSIVEKRFNSGVKLEKAMVEKKSMHFLYASGDVYNFMNMETYEQIEITKDQIGDDAKFLKEDLIVDVTFFQGELLGVILPEKIEMKVVETEPAVKGNTTNNALKDAVLETGLKVRVPLFVEQGEMIIVSTKDGKYVSRA